MCYLSHALKHRCPIFHRKQAGMNNLSKKYKTRPNSHNWEDLPENFHKSGH